jgi:hypothetical protein
MAKALAYVSGTALAPGVSRNNRLYTREAISGAVRRAQRRIADGKRPIGMYTYHETTNTRELVGAVTKIWQEDDGCARYVAAIADTGTGRDIANLVNPEGDEPAFLRGVSIRGNWVGSPRRERSPDGSGFLESGSDLEIGRLDWTSEPGVDGAGVDSFRYADAGDGESGDRWSISESAPEALVETAITEEAMPASPLTEAAPSGGGETVPAGVREALRVVFGERVTEAATPAVSKRGSGLSDDGGRVYADPGYQKDKKQRYDLSTRQKAKSAWAYVNQADNAGKYTGPQLKQVKKRIVAALKKFGVTVAAEGWSIDPAVEVTEAIAEYAGMDPECAGSYSLSATNGPTTVTVCSWGLDPADLQVILAQACKGAGLALMSLDPDMDADIDVEGAPAEDDDGDADALASRIAAAIRGESAETLDDLLAEMRPAGDGETVTETAPTEDPAPDPAAADREGTEDPGMAETTTTTETAATAPASFSQADLDGAIASALARADEQRKARKAAKRSASAAPAEAAPAAPVTETGDDRIARLVREGVASAMAAAAPTAPVVTETEDQRVKRLVAEAMVTERQNLTEQGGGPGRKGLSPSGAVTENSGGGGEPGLNQYGLPSEWPNKPLHEFTSDEWEQYGGPVIVRHVLGNKADLLA